MKNSNYIYEIKNYLQNNDFSSDIKKTTNLLKNLKMKNKSVFIFGNGGSATIAEHFYLDLINKCNIKSHIYNLSSLLTCFSNDYKFENAIIKYLDIYLQKGDLIFLISSSGKSQNMTKTATKFKNNFNLITLTGFGKNNKLSSLGKVNIWVDSKNYNVVETLHQIFLLQLVENLAD